MWTLTDEQGRVVKFEACKFCDDNAKFEVSIRSTPVDGKSPKNEVTIKCGRCGRHNSYEMKTEYKMDAYKPQAISDFFEAIVQGNVEEICGYLDDGIDPNIMEDEQTALESAARIGSMEIMKILIDRGATLPKDEIDEIIEFIIEQRDEDPEWELTNEKEVFKLLKTAAKDI